MDAATAKAREFARLKTRAWVAANPERKRATDKAYRDANKDAARQYGAQWRAENKEKLRAKKKQYAEKNKEKLRAKRVEVYERNAEQNRIAAREWARANPDKRRAQRAARKAQKLRATPPWADLELVACLYAYAAHLTRSTGVEHHVDHEVPLRSPLVCGLHTFDNLQVLTSEENMRKGNRFPYYGS